MKDYHGVRTATADEVIQLELPDEVQLAMVVLGGRKVSARRARARSVADEEVSLRAWELFRSEDLLDERTVETMLSGLSTRRYERALEPTGEQGSSTSRSAVSRRFVRRTRESLGEL